MKNNRIPFLAMISLSSVLLLVSCSPKTPPVTPPETAATEAPPAVEAPVEPTVEAEPTSEPPAAGSVSFAKNVQPILDGSCTSCHGTGRAGGGLDLATYEGVLAGGNSGPSVLPSDPGGSLLVQVVETGRMPKAGTKLSADQIKILSDWISQGAQNN